MNQKAFMTNYQKLPNPEGEKIAIDPITKEYVYLK